MAVISVVCMHLSAAILRFISCCCYCVIIVTSAAVLNVRRVFALHICDSSRVISCANFHCAIVVTVQSFASVVYAMALSHAVSVRIRCSHHKSEFYQTESGICSFLMPEMVVVDEMPIQTLLMEMIQDRDIVTMEDWYDFIMCMLSGIITMTWSDLDSQFSRLKHLRPPCLRNYSLC